ncbi:hypothetical protein L0F63_001306 [Massospora cicadina]|nr:hypothetical protein L0F63_001306 [Massospora cicadina]
MVTDQNLQGTGSVGASPSKESVKRASEGTELVNETKTKLHRGENGEIEVAIVDGKTGDAVNLASLNGVELFSLIKDEIEKLSSKFGTAPACNNFRLSSLITEDEKSALIKLFEVAQDKFASEFCSVNVTIHPPMWFACYAMTKLLFGQVMNLKDSISEARTFVNGTTDKFHNADPSPSMLLSLVHLNELIFGLKDHFDSLYPNGVDVEADEPFTAASLPSHLTASLQEISALADKVSEVFASGQTSEVDLGVPRRLFIEWIETLCTLFSFDKLLVAEKEFASSALEMLARALEKIGAHLFLSITSEALSSINTLLFKVFTTYGSIYPQPVKSILLAADRISQTFLDSNEGSFELFTSFGHVSLALSKQLGRDATPEEDNTESVAQFYAKGIECFERALEFKKDASLEAYLNELNDVEASGEGPEYFALLSNEEIADDAEDGEFVPNEEETLDNNEEIVVNPAEEDLSEGVEDEDVPLEQIPEVIVEPGQVLLEGTRSASQCNALVEDEDEEADPDFVPRVTDVEEELGQSDAEDETCLPEDESASEDKSMVRENLELPSSILAIPEPLEDEPEEADPDFIPLPQEVEEELTPSDNDDEAKPTAQAEEQDDEDDEEDESFVPSAQEESDDEDIVDDEEDEPEAA